MLAPTTLNRLLRLVAGIPFLLSSLAQAQPVIQGVVQDAVTSKPIPFATVYVNASTRGTTADAEGHYQLPGVSPGTVELVASSVGYTIARRTFRLGDEAKRTVDFSLKPDSKALQTVTVLAKRPKAYERMLREFKRELLGDTPFAGKCQITNENAVSLTMDEGRLEAQASEPLVIDNKALGYRLYYELTHFDSYRQATHYAGTSRFEVLKPENAEQEERWARNRQKAYRGSIRHLLTSLMAGTYEQEGFLVYKAKFDAPADPSITIAQIANDRPSTPIQADSLFRRTPIPSERQLVSPKPLEVFYTRQRTLSSPYRDMPYAYSIIYMPPGKAAVVTTDGWIVQPNGMEVRGIMSDDRLATLLPADWQPAQQTGLEQETPPDEGTVLPADSLVRVLATQWAAQQKNSAPSVFLHTDKGVYMTGDRLFFSAYVLDPDTHQPLVRPEADQENPIHLELRAPNGGVIQHQWIRVKEGRTTGSFRLADSLSTGLYRLRAYAEADAGNSRPGFERTVTIVNGLAVARDSQPTATSVASDSLDVQFLPEGGHWVTGLPTRLGIRAVNKQGIGVAVSGTIRSGQGAEPVPFKTNFLGLGSIELTPLPDQRYVADVVATAGTTRFAMPVADSTGLVLRADITTDSSQLIVQIQASPLLAQLPVYIRVQSRGQLLQQTKLQLLNGRARLSIPAAKLPVGIAQITLFTANGQPQAERLVFIPERLLPIQTSIITDKTAYQPRESVTMSLRVADGFGEPLSLIGSLSVTDLQLVPADTNAATIRTHLLLTGELRSRVERPNYYLSSNRPDIRRALDDLLLTQGWRRINWRLNGDQPQSTPTATNGLLLRGRVVDKKNKAVPEANVLLTFTGRAGDSFARSARTNQQGQFLIDDLLITDTVTVQSRLMTTAFKPIDNARVVFDAPSIYFSTPDSAGTLDLAEVRPFLALNQQRQASNPDDYRDRDARQLKEVVVRAAKPDDDSQARKASLHGDADATLLFDEKSRAYTSVYDMIAGRVAGVQVVGTTIIIHGVGSFSSENIQPLFILDGSYITDLSVINPSQVERIEVIKNAGASIYGARGGSGVIAFFTKKGGKANTKAFTDSEPKQTLYGYLTEREFYTPKYDSPPDSTTRPPDRRDVLYWKPMLATNGQGVTTFRFPLSDTAQKIRITVQGITNYGRPVYISRLVKVR